MSKSRPAPVTLTRKQHSRVERERTMQRRLLIGTIAVAVVVVGLIVYGLIDLNVLQPRRPVARVNDASISLVDFQKAVRYQRFQLLGNYVQVSQQAQLFGSDPQFKQYFDNQLSQFQTQLTDAEGLGRQVLNNMIDDQIIRQEAAKRGITVSKEEVDARMHDNFGYFPNGTPTPTLTPTPFPTDVIPPTATINPTVMALWTPTPTLTPTATLEPTATATPGPSATPALTSTPRPSATPLTIEGYQQRVVSYTADLNKFTQLDESELRYFVEAGLYREKVLKAVTADVPTSEEQILARHILVADQTLALAVLAKFNGGEDWAALAKQYSTDTSNKDNGGLLPWFGRNGQMVAEFSTAAFSMTVGTVSQPVQTQFGWHLIQVLDRQNRALTDSDLKTKRETAFTAWLQAQRTAAGDKVKIIDGWQKNVPVKPDLTDLNQVGQ
jgi:peptidyl-prolyl cis-trans isomerase D